MCGQRDGRVRGVSVEKFRGGVGKCVGEVRCVGKCGVGAGKCVGVWGEGEAKKGVGSVLGCGER